MTNLYIVQTALEYNGSFITPPYICNVHQHSYSTGHQFVPTLKTTDLYLQFTLAMYSYKLHVITQFNN